MPWRPTMSHETKSIVFLGILAGCLLVLTTLAGGQPDRAAFERARDEALRKTQPTYHHSPIVATWGNITVNMHNVMAYHPSDAGGVVLYPGGTMLDVPYEEFHAVMQRSNRIMVWRPELPR